MSDELEDKIRELGERMFNSNRNCDVHKFNAGNILDLDNLCMIYINDKYQDELNLLKRLLIRKARTIISYRNTIIVKKVKMRKTGIINCADDIEILEAEYMCKNISFNFRKGQIYFGSTVYKNTNFTMPNHILIIYGENDVVTDYLKDMNDEEINFYFNGWKNIIYDKNAFD